MKLIREWVIGHGPRRKWEQQKEAYLVGIGLYAGGQKTKGGYVHITIIT